MTFWQIWNLCIGYMGLQFGFALQNANMGRIFETLGASYHSLALLFVAAPVTGLVVQPLIGHYSDRIWTRFGRRRPFLLAGAVLASLSLIVLPHSPYLWMAVGLLWILDAAANMSVQPMRTLVGDLLPQHQRPFGFALQTFFIGIASMIASALPWLLTNLAGVANTAPAGTIPDVVKYAFYTGAGMYLSCVIWTVITTKESERLPENALPSPVHDTPLRSYKVRSAGLRWLVIGLCALVLLAVLSDNADMHSGLYVLALGVTVWGSVLLWFHFKASALSPKGISSLLSTLFCMPDAMRKLGTVQFFSWFPFFTMWTYLTAAVTSHHFHSKVPASALYNSGADWVGVLHAVYNGVPLLGAFLIPVLIRRLSLRITHLLCLTIGAVGFTAVYFITSPYWLILPMVAIGLAWTSILTTPYAYLVNLAPANQMGTYMGLLNLFIVLPQIVAACLLGVLVQHWFADTPIYTMLLAGLSMLIAAACTLRLPPTQN